MKIIRYDKISTYFKLNFKSFIIATVTGIVFNSLMALVPIIQGKLIDAFKAQEDAKYIISFALIFLIFIIFIQVNRFFKRYYVRDFSNKMVLQMRTASFHNMITSDISEFTKTSKGDIMNKNLADIKDSAEGVRKVLTEIYDSIILMLGYFISMLIMDYVTTLIVTVFLVISVTIANLLKKKIYRTTSDYKKTFSFTKDVTLNSLENEIYYRGFGVSNRYYQKYSNTQDDFENKSIKSMIYKGSLTPIYQAIALIGLFFVIYFCGKKVMDETWLIGTFSAYLATYVLVANKVSKTGKVFNAVTTLCVSWKRCLPFLVAKDEMEQIEFLSDNTSLEVSNLTFGYDKSFVLKNISFSLQKGESLGICGVIHSGKSTLGGALSGIYEYEGSVKLYGVELNDARNKLSEDFISYAPSQIEVFNDTIKYNIAFTNDTDVRDELRISCLGGDVKGFEKKENEILSHSMINLSGGQQKRLQIARSIYNKPKLIIMDDPFNAIDISMSEEITNNILSTYKDSIIVLINNKREILKKMDYVLFLKNDGYIYGKYDELLNDKDFSNLVGGDNK